MNEENIRVVSCYHGKMVYYVQDDNIVAYGV
jgi:hypothetical protein